MHGDDREDTEQDEEQDEKEEEEVDAGEERGRFSILVSRCVSLDVAVVAVDAVNWSSCFCLSMFASVFVLSVHFSFSSYKRSYPFISGD